MKFVGIKRTIAVDENYGQLQRLEQFWNEMRGLFPVESLLGLGTNWSETELDYYIGKIDENWQGGADSIDIPDDDWHEFSSTDKDADIERMYQGIYEQGTPDYEIESLKDGRFMTKVHFRKDEKEQR